MSENAVEIASLVRQMVLETLKTSAPGITEQMREAIANSIAIKLRAYFSISSDGKPIAGRR